MNYFYITGTSSGLGRAMALQLLASENNRVFGISRSRTIEHERYRHFTADLNENLAHFHFSLHTDAESIVFVNNSGILGPVKPAGRIDHQDLKKVIRVNLTAPLILLDKFLKTYQEVPCKKILINISSGAARYPFPSWMGYCSSKAGLDMATQVIAAEQKNMTYPVFAFSVAPGIVDTQMQNEIRSTLPEDFPLHQTFVDYKEKNQLWPPEKSAAAILSICDNPMKYGEVLLDVRKL
jgi:benzil reductase ((S)-benzoin forming)